jgi:holliday junction DNA helicase RuvA
MIAFLHGRVLEKQPNRIIVDVGGVGYDVAVPLSTFYGVGDPGAEVSLRVHTHVREDALTLFGFLTPLELALFERLIAVSGIGPKLALAVLSGIEPAIWWAPCSAATSRGSRPFPAWARRRPSASGSS